MSHLADLPVLGSGDVELRVGDPAPPEQVRDQLGLGRRVLYDDPVEVGHHAELRAQPL